MARRVNSVRFVGRNAEADALAAAVTAAEAERATMVLLGGEAGVGKTRLVREVEARVGAEGAVALRGECIELSGGEFPFAPVVGALRDAGWEVLAEPVESLAAQGRAELAQLVPEIGRWLDDPPLEQLRPPPQGRLFELLLALLRRLGEGAPVLFVIEDAHWADASTRDFIGFLARNLSTERVAVIVTYRLDELSRDHPLRALIGELIRCDPIETLTLERLGRDEVEVLLEEIIGEPAPLALVDEVFARSDGNPFFAEELLAARAGGEADSLPASLRDALLLRVEALPAEAGELLKHLAVLGRPASDRLLGTLAGMDEAACSAALRAALAAHILRGGDDGTFAFRHALVREAVSAELMPGESAALHRTAAETLSRTGAGTAAELAYHWHAAGVNDQALAASIEAGLDAERAYASAEARLHFERAASLWDELQPETGSLALDRADLLRHTAEAARLTGDWDAAAALCRDALALVDADAEPLRAAMLNERLGEYLLWDDEASLACYSTALSLLPPEHRCERARILGAKALALHFLLRWEEARDCAESALLEAEKAGGRSEEGYARNVLGLALAFLGDPEQGEQHVRVAKEIAEQLGGAEDVARAYAHLAEVLRIRGKVAEALEVMLEGEDLAARMGMTSSFGRAMSVNAAEDLIRIGRWDEAAARLAWTARLGLRPGAQLYQHSLEGRLATARGEVDAATRHLSEARAISDDQTPVEYIADIYAGFAELALWSGQIEDARRECADGLARIGDRAEPLYSPVLFWLGSRAAADAAEVARMKGNDAEVAPACEDAQEMTAGLEQLIARYSMTESPAEATAYLALCRAEVARGGSTPSADAWAHAASSWDGLGQAYPAAYCRWRLTEALLAAGGHRREAAASLAQARAAADDLGARPLLRAVEALARAARLDITQDAPAATDEPSAGSELGLTARELEVLRVVAEGCTNRQIAERLFISEKTAGVHVSHILSKLNAENRVQAAAIAHRSGLLDTASAPD